MEKKREQEQAMKNGGQAEEKVSEKEFQMSETWAQDALQDLEDFIEEQGIHIRQ